MAEIADSYEAAPPARRRLRSLLRSASAPAAIALLGTSCAACGGGGPGRRVGGGGSKPAMAASPATAATAMLRGDEDGDTRGRAGYYDGDDGEVSGSGRAAGPAEKRSIAQLVQRYYAAAAAADGDRACALTYYILAETIPEAYAHPPGPLYLRGMKTCPAILSRVFERFHAQIRLPVKTTAVRIDGDRAYALLGSSTMPAGYIEARREGRSWKIGRVLAAPLP